MEAQKHSPKQAQQLSGFELAHKFLTRFQKYRYHVPASITNKNITRTHRVFMYVHDILPNSSNVNSKFNQYIFEAWLKRFNKIRNMFDILIYNIPSYYHDYLKEYLKELCFIADSYTGIDYIYSDYYLLLFKIADLFYYYDEMLYTIRNAIYKGMSKKITVKFIRPNPPKYRRYAQFVRYLGYEKGRRGLHYIEEEGLWHS